MDSNRYQEAKKLFEAARGLGGEERRAYLETHCAADEAMRDEVESLLKAHDQLTGFLSAPALGSHFNLPGASTPPPNIDETPAESFGHFTIIRTLGEGGMGIVYLAQQDNPRREVALKVIRAGVTSRKMLARFEYEAQVLGNLQHQGIAHIYEAGTVNDGNGEQPFFAMEYVRGRSLLEYAETHRLGTRQRLELLGKICEAVDHAHQKGVIHRDLKPGNILVTETGQPKILDFGVARATDSDIQTTTLQTDMGQLIGTVPYMSPEQAAGDPNDLDTRSDVYALGVIGYELLAGRLPYKMEGLMIHEAVRIIREETPIPLSTVNRVFRGDVETIIGKALEKDRHRRYQSARDLAADIDRYLSERPITARPPSTLYQFGKFTRRNRALVGGIAAVILTLIAGVVGTSIGMARAVTARDEAQTQLAKAQQVTGFLRRLLAGSDPTNAAGRDTQLLRSILDDAARDIDVDLAGQPEAEALIRNTIGSTYRMIGDFDAAETHLNRALELVEAYHEADDPEFLETRYNLAWLRLGQGRGDEAMTLFQDNVERRKRLYGALHPDTFQDAIGILHVYQYQHRWFDMANDAEELLELARDTLGNEHEHTINLVSLLADAYNFLGRYEESIALNKAALDLKRRLWGASHPGTLANMQILASSYRQLKRLDEAEPLYLEVYERMLDIYGPDHLKTNNAKNSLALLYKFQDRYKEAEELYLQVLDFNRRVLGEPHQHTLVTMNNLASVYHQQDRLPEAERLMVERRDICARHFGPRDSKTLNAWLNLAVMLDYAGERQRSVQQFEELIASARQDDAANPKLLGYFLLMYGQCLLRLERWEDTEAALLESVELQGGPESTMTGNLRNVMLTLAKLYETWERPEEARRWRELVP